MKYTMPLAEAIVVIERLLDDETLEIEAKIGAIERIAQMETHNSVTKQNLVKALRWLYKTFDFATDNNDGHKPMTNGDSVRAMTDEELAKAAANHIPLHSWPNAVRDIYLKNHVSKYVAWLEWFKAVKEDET